MIAQLTYFIHQVHIFCFQLTMISLKYMLRFIKNKNSQLLDLVLISIYFYTW